MRVMAEVASFAVGSWEAQTWRMSIARSARRIAWPEPDTWMSRTAMLEVEEGCTRSERQNSEALNSEMSAKAAIFVYR